MSLLKRFFQLNSTRLVIANRIPILSTTITADGGYDPFFTQKRFAARKGKRIAATREKQKLARIRREELKKLPPKVWKPAKLLMNKKLNFISNKFNDEDRRDLDEIVDNVYIISQYKEKKLPLIEALELIRETHTPAIYDEPNALIDAKLELSLRTKKKTKFLENMSGVIAFPNLFAFSVKRKVIAICKTEEHQIEARNAGAELAGSTDIVRMLKVGDLTMDNFDDIVCHEEMLPDLTNIRGILGYSLPTKLRGNVGTDMAHLVSYFVNGIEFKLTKDHFEPDFGVVKLPFGRLGQTDEQLKDNFAKLLEVIDYYQPEGAPGEFISRVIISSEPCAEQFPVSFWEHIKGYKNPNEEDDEDVQEMKSIKAKAKAK